MDIEEKIHQINYDGKNTIISALGIEVTDLGDNFICGKMPVDERTVQIFGILHGGASVALAETLGSIAGSMQIDVNTEMVVGVEKAHAGRGFTDITLHCGRNPGPVHSKQANAQRSPPTELDSSDPPSPIGRARYGGKFHAHLPSLLFSR